MTFTDWFETDGRQAVGASGLGGHGASVRAICQRAFAAGEEEGRLGADATASARDNWVAYFYLLGVFPAGSVVIGRGRGRGDAWLDARLHVKRFFRPFIGVEVRSAGDG